MIEIEEGKPTPEWYARTAETGHHPFQSWDPDRQRSAVAIERGFRIVNGAVRTKSNQIRERIVGREIERESPALIEQAYIEWHRLLPREWPKGAILGVIAEDRRVRDTAPLYGLNAGQLERILEQALDLYPVAKKNALKDEAA